MCWTVTVHHQTQPKRSNSKALKRLSLSSFDLLWLKSPKKLACWCFHWAAGNAGKTQACAHAHARASVIWRKMVRVHSHPYWRWDRRCPLSDHWLIVTNSSQPDSIWNLETCTNLWRSRRLVWLLDATPTSPRVCICIYNSIPPWKYFQKVTENSVSASSDKDAKSLDTSEWSTAEI